MTTLDELFIRSRRRTGADDAPKCTGTDGTDGARAHSDGSTDGTDAPFVGAHATDAPQRLSLIHI